jgi:hypothetical protein
MNKDEGDFEYILNLQKIEEDAEKYLIVAGIATTETMDHDGEIVDIGSVRDVWKSYMENPVVRYFHGKDGRNPDAVGMVIPEYTDASGKTFKTEMTDRGPFIVAKISNAPDTESIRTKISEGILKGFSIGGRAKRVKEYSHELGKDINRVITKRISEISIVDLPANPDSFFNVLKSACVGDQCKIKSEEMDGEKIETKLANDTDMLKSVEDEIAKLEQENIGLQKQIDESQSHTKSKEEVVMKNTDKNPGGKHMEQDGEIVRFAPEELRDFIKGTMTEVAEESAILEKADDYDRLLSETKDLRAKIEALESKVTSQAKALQNQPQTTMKSEETGDSETDETAKGETESDELGKVASLEARLRAVEESPLYKATQGDEEPMDDKKKSKKGHLANIVSESFGTGGK